MTLLFIGTTQCLLCGNVISEGVDVWGFTAFVINPTDPLFPFSDASFHTQCLLTSANGKMAIEYGEECYTKLFSKVCIVTGELITDPDEWFFIPCLTSDKGSPLHEFNFTTIKKSNLINWPKRHYFATLITELKESGTWGDEGNRSLTYYIENLNGLA